MDFDEVFVRTDEAYHITQRTCSQCQSSVVSEGGSMGCRSGATYYKPPRNRRLQSVGNLMHILANAPIPRPDRPDRLAQALLPPMPAAPGRPAGRRQPPVVGLAPRQPLLRRAIVERVLWQGVEVGELLEAIGGGAVGVVVRLYAAERGEPVGAGGGRVRHGLFLFLNSRFARGLSFFFSLEGGVWVVPRDVQVS